MTERSPESRPREGLVALLLLLAGDFMLWVAFLGAAVVLRSGDLARFEAHRAAAAGSLYTWLALPFTLLALVALGLWLVVGRRRRWAGIAVALCCLLPPTAMAGTLAAWSRTQTQLVELPSTEAGTPPQRFVVQIKTLASSHSLDGRFVHAAPPDWTPADPLPADAEVAGELHDRVLLESRLIAEGRNVPARHAFFAVTWIVAVALILHWVAGAILVLVAAPEVGAVWIGWTGVVTLCGFVALV